MTAGDIPELEQSKISGLTAALAAKVPTSRTINSKPLSANIDITKGDVGLGNVENKSSADILAGITESDIPDGMAQGKILNLATDLESKVAKTTQINGVPIGTGATLKTSDMIPIYTTLPTTGNATGDLAIKDGVLYKWVDPT